MPSDYISELARKADEKITAESWRKNDRIRKHLAEKPHGYEAIKQELQSRAALQAEIAWHLGYTPSQWLLAQELEEVLKRRDKAGVEISESNDDAYKRAATLKLMGLCFSGGGIRSATFNLGVLQGLAELKLLKCFDYLSSVSGGGYIHQWLAAWINRESKKKNQEEFKGFEQVRCQLVPPPGENNPGMHPEPVRWLRRYSNYLTPEVGLLTADTWVAFGTWLRNTILNQIILVSGLFFLMLLPHLVLYSRGLSIGGPAARINSIAILYLFLVAIALIGKNLSQMERDPESAPGAGSLQGALFWQASVQSLIVLPLLLACVLVTLLSLSRVVPVIFDSPDSFVLTFILNTALLFVFAAVMRLLGNHVIVPLLVGGALILTLDRLQIIRAFSADSQPLPHTFAFYAALDSTLALTITFWGRALASYLRHHRSLQAGKNPAALWIWLRAMVLLLLAATIAGSIGGACDAIVHKAVLWPLQSWGDAGWRLAIVIGPPLVLAGPLLTILITIGLLGRAFANPRREWLARMAAWIGLYALLWTVFVGCSLLGRTMLAWFFVHKDWMTGKLTSGHYTTLAGALVAWIGTTVGGLLAGNSSKSGGTKADAAPSRFDPIEILAVVGPYAFIAGLLLLVAAWAEATLARFESYSWAVFLVPLAICLLFAWRVDINEFSMHAFYRDRLTRCYLGASNASRNPNPFTGFDEEDANVALSDLVPSKGYYGPYPLFCTTLNLTFGEELAWQERKGASFVFAPLYSGYDVGWLSRSADSNLRFNGYVETEKYAYPSPGIHICTAAAISGAAASPNWGYHTNPATAFLLTVFNVRIGWWLRNPRSIQQDGTRLKKRFAGSRPSPSPPFALLHLTNELLGRTNDSSSYVYLTDGGHFDNMGLYELVRRRCRYIVICDGEEDGDLQFEGIGMAIRKCRIDFGAEVCLDLRPLQHAEESEYSAAHCVVGTIRYPEDVPGDESGVVVYLKSSLTGDEPGDILNYKREHASFPHDTTLNQFFTESQFESYRRLGHHVALSIFDPARPGDLNSVALAMRQNYFDNLSRIWCAVTPEIKQHSPEHSKSYSALLEEVRTDPHLNGLFDMLFDRSNSGQPLEWRKRPHADAAYGVRFCSKLIEFIFIVYMQLNLVLPDNRFHPFAQGWFAIFQNWARIDIVRDAWRSYGASYSKGFQLFAESESIGLPKDHEPWE